jgi:hypothetical protein
LQAYHSPDCIDNFREQPQTSWYSATIDVYGKHLSGLLLVKNMEDGRFRTVFTSEAGVTFFDFEFKGFDGFRVHKVIPQLDRKAVINTLRKDFALMLRLPFTSSRLEVFRLEDEILTAAPQKNGTAYFITDTECASLRRLEWASKGKRVVSIVVEGPYEQPVSMQIDHHNFNMTIRLKKISRE